MPKAVAVELSWYEIYSAYKVGIHRHVEAVYKRKLRTKKMGKKNITVHCEGALGELAVAKAANRYWGGGVNVGKRVADVGNMLEVRCRDETNGARDLIVRDDDPDDRVMVLVTWTEDSIHPYPDPPTLYVHGWIKIKKAKREEYKQNYGGYGTAYFVPKDKLNPMEDLP